MKSVNPVLSKLIQKPALRLKKFTLSDLGVDLGVLVDAIAKTELFCNASEAFLEKMLKAMSVRPVHAGEFILRQGRRSDAFLLLACGEAEVRRSREGDRVVRQLAVVSRPEPFGEEALLAAEIRSVSVKMLTAGFVLRIRRADFAKLIMAESTHWIDATEALAMNLPVTSWIWLGSARTRPAGMTVDAVTVKLERLRQRLAELIPAQDYLCCGRDDATSALAAFLLNQRGFKAHVVRDGRHVSVMPPGRKELPHVGG